MRILCVFDSVLFTSTSMPALWKLHTVVFRDRKFPCVDSLSVHWLMCGHFGQPYRLNPLPPRLVCFVDTVAKSNYNDKDDVITIIGNGGPKK